MNDEHPACRSELPAIAEFSSSDNSQWAKLEALFLLAHCDFTTLMSQTEQARVVAVQQLALRW